MATELRDIRHLRITSAALRHMLHEAWKAGNDSMAPHHMEDGTAERFEYVDKQMELKGYKKPKGK